MKLLRNLDQALTLQDRSRSTLSAETPSLARPFLRSRPFEGLRGVKVGRGARKVRRTRTVGAQERAGGLLDTARQETPENTAPRSIPHDGPHSLGAHDSDDAVRQNTAPRQRLSRGLEVGRMVDTPWTSRFPGYPMDPAPPLQAREERSTAGASNVFVIQKRLGYAVDGS